MNQRSGPAAALPLFAVLAAAAAFAALQIAAAVIAGGVFDYPLDDPYIHMAIAEQIARGGYGVNAGEIAAAASSPLFPVLLTPFAGTELQRYLPLLWNIAGLLGAAWLWGRILWLSGFGGTALGVALAVVGPVALNMAGLAFTGMEHMLHVAASLAILLGLLHYADEDRIPPVLILGILFAPLLRFEGLALSSAGALVVMQSGHARAGLGLMALAVLPVAGFAGLLTALGLDPLPSSVRFKMAAGEAVSDGVLGYFRFKMLTAIVMRPGQILLLTMTLALAFLALSSLRHSRRRLILPVLLLAGAGHILLGKYGWMDRYEIYILVTMVAGLLAVAGTARNRAPALVCAVPILLAGAFYLPTAVREYPYAPRALYVQQGQMARFAKEHLDEAVAVNDIGYVAWRNPHYVLDLWGLANAEIMELLTAGQNRPGWAGAQADKHDVRFAMLYREWFADDELGPGWRKLGALNTDVHAFYLGETQVNFWLNAAAVGDAEPYLEKLRAWAADLPPGASFTFAPDTVETAEETG